MEWIEIGAYVLTLILGLLSSVFGTKYKKYKAVFKVIIEAAEDGEVTKEEMKKIVRTLKKL